MAMNVFGNPITNSTVEGMPEYADKKELTRKDRATVALNMKNARANDVNVRQFVENVGKNSDFNMTTLCVVYNATGDTITFVNSHDWSGHLAHSPYPVSIANGQWGGFVHVSGGKDEDDGSCAAVVYRSKNESGHECDWMMSWRNPYDRSNFNNSAHTEVHEKDHFKPGDIWKIVHDDMEKSGLVKRDTRNGCMSSVSTGTGYKAVFEAIFTLENA